jgi:hypothetical protein
MREEDIKDLNIQTSLENLQDPSQGGSYKVVINCSYGIFDLSWVAIRWLLDNGYTDERLGRDDVRDDMKKSYIERTIPRHHPLLVKCVETLGGKAGGAGSVLVIHEINTDLYHIEELNGFETLTTPTTQRWISCKGPEFNIEPGEAFMITKIPKTKYRVTLRAKSNEAIGVGVQYTALDGTDGLSKKKEAPDPGIALKKRGRPKKTESGTSIKKKAVKKYNKNPWLWKG